MATIQGDKQHDPKIDPDYLDEKKHIDSEVGQFQEVGVVKDGLKVYPQPTADPLDPLNWSFLKKHGILAIVMYL